MVGGMQSTADKRIHANGRHAKNLHWRVSGLSELQNSLGSLPAKILKDRDTRGEDQHELEVRV
jgi:hypothetical protein